MLIDTLLKKKFILRVYSTVLFCLFLSNKSIFTIRRGFLQVSFSFFLTSVGMKRTAVYSPGQTGP